MTPTTTPPLTNKTKGNNIKKKQHNNYLSTQSHLHSDKHINPLTTNLSANKNPLPLNYLTDSKKLLTTKATDPIAPPKETQNDPSDKGKCVVPQGSYGLEEGTKSKNFNSDLPPLSPAGHLYT